MSAMKLQIVPARQGARWVRAGFGVFFRRPLAFAALFTLFLSAGLVWSLTSACGDPLGVQTFFLACVVVAGLVGALTASAGILFIQALPGLAALIVVRLA